MNKLLKQLSELAPLAAAATAGLSEPTLYYGQWKPALAGLTALRCLPEIGEKVLLLTSGNIAVGQLTWAYRWLLTGGSVHLLQDVTHWMPLPAAPTSMEGSQVSA